jgi:RNA polymerase sigma-70 factor (ECF subfamily)
LNNHNQILESQIIDGLKNGDQSIFKLLFHSYYKPLSSYALTFIKYADVDEEIVQEIFIKIWENRNDLNISSSLRSYLFRCVHNNCINYIKHIEVKNKQTREITEDIFYHSELANLSSSGSSLEMIVSGELEACLEKVIHNLPGECRRIFILKRYEQLTNQEIADQLNISINTVKTQLLRAFEKLREAVKKFNEEK